MKQFHILSVFALLTITSLEGKEFSLNTSVRANYTKAGQSVTQEKSNGVTVLRFSMDPAQKKWGEFYWLNTKSFPPFQTLKVTVHLQKGNSEWPKGMSLRLMDRKLEVFQFSPKEIKFETNDKYTAVYEISAGGKQKSFWGGDRNGIMDQPCRFQGMSVSFSAKTGKCDVLITGIEWETKGTPPKVSKTDAKKKNPSKPFPFRFDLKTSHPIPVVGPDEKEFYAYITNSGNRHTSFNISFTIRDAEGKTVFHKPFFPAFVFQTNCQYFRLPVPEKFGLYDVETVIRSQKDPEIKWVASRKFAKLCSTELLPVWKKGEFRFGIDSNKMGSDPSLDAAAAGLAGTSFVRVSCSSNSIWPDRGTTYAEGHLYRFRELKKNNIDPTVIIWATFARWMYEKEEDKKKPGFQMIHPDLWREYCDKVFRSFGKYVNHFEVWNEPDLNTFSVFPPEDYYRLAKIAREERDKYAPDAELLSAGFCNFTGKGGFHEKAMTLCRGLFDIHCFHGHGSYSSYRERIDGSLLPMRRKIGIDKTVPWYPHETAITTTGFSQHIQAVTLFRKLIFSWSRGAVGYTWYCLRDPGRDPANPEHNFGLLDFDYYPKEVYPVYRMLAQTFRGNTVFVRTFPENSMAESYLFRRGNDLLVPAWNRRSDITGSELYFITDAKEAELIDLFGNVSPLKITDSRVRFPLGKDPATLRLKQAKSCVRADGLCRFAEPEADLTSDAVPFTLIFTNPHASEGTFTLKAELPRGLSAKFPESVTVPGKQTLRKEILITPDPDAGFSGSIQEVKVHCALNGIPCGTAGLYLTPAVLLKASFTEKPSAVMNKREQVLELFDADPGNVFRLRKDDSDLSARIWIASDAEDLKFRVLVTDDIHRQKEEAKSVWKADSLQIYLAVPGQPKVWEINTALHEDGRVLKRIHSTGNRSHADVSRIKAAVTRRGTQTEYLVSIPWAMLGAKERCIRYNLLINESDSDRREAMMRLAPGVGTGSREVFYFPILKQAPNGQPEIKKQ